MIIEPPEALRVASDRREPLAQVDKDKAAVFKRWLERELSKPITRFTKVKRRKR